MQERDDDGGFPLIFAFRERLIMRLAHEFSSSSVTWDEFVKTKTIVDDEFMLFQAELRELADRRRARRSSSA